MLEKLFSVKEAAALMGITARAMPARILSGTIRAVLLPAGRRVYAIPASALLRYRKRIVQGTP